MVLVVKHSPLGSLGLPFGIPKGPLGSHAVPWEFHAIPCGPKWEVRSLGSLASLAPQLYDQAFKNLHTRTKTYGLGQSGISAGLNFQLG